MTIFAACTIYIANRVTTVIVFFRDVFDFVSEKSSKLAAISLNMHAILEVLREVTGMHAPCINQMTLKELS
jgi:hypothetical protein